MQTRNWIVHTHAGAMKRSCRGVPKLVEQFFPSSGKWKGRATASQKSMWTNPYLLQYLNHSDFELDFDCRFDNILTLNPFNSIPFFEGGALAGQHEAFEGAHNCSPGHAPLPRSASWLLFAPKTFQFLLFILWACSSEGCYGFNSVSCNL